MAEKSEDGKISLSSSKAISSVAYTLKIPNFFTLPEYDDTDFKLDSPSFEFADATWCFKFVKKNKRISREEVESETLTKESESLDEGWKVRKEFAVYMVRLNSKITEQTILSHILLLDADNEIYDEDGDCTCFNEKRQSEEYYMWSFDTAKPSYDRRSSLTLMVHLLHIDSSKVDEDHVSVTTDTSITSLAHDFKDVLLNGQDHNLTINVKDKKFRAHQDILRARSEVFRSMLSHDMREKNSGVIDVADCEPEAFQQLLCYLYTGKVETLDKNNVFDLYYAADKYNLPSLKKECYNYIKNSLTLSTVCAALELALKHSDASLLESASSYFFNNLDDILPTVEWQLFMKENLTAANELIIKSVKKLRDTMPYSLD